MQRRVRTQSKVDDYQYFVFLFSSCQVKVYFIHNCETKPTEESLLADPNVNC